MPLIHAFDMQAFAVCLLGSVKKHLGQERKHPLLDNLLIMLQKLAACPTGSNISFHIGRTRFSVLLCSLLVNMYLFKQLYFQFR